MAGWEGAAYAGGQFLNDMIKRGMKNNKTLDNFFGLTPPQPELPPNWVMAKEHSGDLSAYLSNALSGNMGYNPGELNAFEQQANQQTRQGADDAAKGLMGSSYGRAHGVTQQQLAGLYGEANKNLTATMTNLFLMQEQLKRANQARAADQLLGAQTSGYQQYISGAFPYQAGAFERDAFDVQGMNDNALLAMLMANRGGGGGGGDGGGGGGGNYNAPAWDS